MSEPYDVIKDLGYCPECGAKARPISLQAIYQYANQVLAEPDLKNKVVGAINWGDLGCTDVQECRSVHGDSHVNLVIEEASPDGNEELKAYLHERMLDKFPDVQFEINTEW